MTDPNGANGADGPVESPLDSPALATGLASLIRPCGDTRRPADPPPAERPVALALSGGGFRATFAGLGVIRYLADAGLLGDLRYVSSVSGGSVANGLLATAWPEVRNRGFTAAAVDELVIEPLASKVRAQSLKAKLIRNVWRAAGRKTRTDVLAWAFDRWLFDGAELEQLDPGCRWIFNAANLTTGVRFGFERDLLGDYVTGLASTSGSGVRVAQAVAASAAVPGAFAAMKVDQVSFPCAGRGVPMLLDGGAYDNSGLEAIDGERYGDVFTVALNAGGVFVTGGFGKFPLVRDLTRANSLLYRQSTTLRTRWMVDRFEAWSGSGSGSGEPAGDGAPPDEAAASGASQRAAGARRGVLFGLAAEIEPRDGDAELQAFVDRYPEHRTFDAKGVRKDLAFVPTVFDQLSPDLIAALVYRGWWLAGASIALHHPGLVALDANLAAPALA